MYPITLDLRDRLAVVVGGGAVATRKVRGLLAAGARVRVIAPRATDEIQAAAARHDLDWRRAAYRAGDIEGAWLAFTATDDSNVNSAVVADARAQRVLVDDTTENESSDFATPAIHRVGHLTFSVDTAGSSPAFARRLLGELSERFDERYGAAAEALRRARDHAKNNVPSAQRGAVLAALAARSIDELAALTPADSDRYVDAEYAALRVASAASSEPSGAASHDTSPASSRADPRAAPPLVAATRGSALALWQTHHVADVLECAGIASSILTVSTRADRVQDRALAALGTDGVFVRELESALRDGRADYAVHSCKDLPSTLPDDMRIVALGPRADARDAYCSERYASFEALPPGAIVGTSSPRRQAQLQAVRPDLRFEPIRGNVETRLRKLRDGHFDAIVLALAGLDRLGARATYTLALSPELLVPAVGQGALALEARADDAALAQRLHAAFADRVTEWTVGAERAFLRTCRGGCQAPVGAYATLTNEELTLRAVIAEPNGRRVVSEQTRAVARTLWDCERIGSELARRMLVAGGEAILAAAVDARAPLQRATLSVPRGRSGAPAPDEGSVPGSPVRAANEPHT